MYPLVLRGLYFGVWVLHLIVADILLSSLLPIAALSPEFTYNTASLIAFSVWKHIQVIFTSTNNAHITLSGTENLRLGESAMVIANHISWTDFYLLQEMALKTGMLGRCRWFAKKQLKWVPLLGWGLWAMKMPLVSRRWTDDQAELDNVFSEILTERRPIWLISFCEGTRFTTSLHRRAQVWCRQNGKNMGTHVLYPRSKGFVASVQKLRRSSHIKSVYDLTIAYAYIPVLNSHGSSEQLPTFQRAPSFLQSIFDPRLDKQWRFYVHVDRHDLRDLPSSDAGIALWLENRWVEKGVRLEKLKQQLDNGQSWEQTPDT